MNGRVCLDASPVVSWIVQEHGWLVVDRLLADPSVQVILPGPAMTEAIATARRKGNQGSAQEISDTLHAHGVHLEHPIDEDLVRAAELLEVSDRRPGPRDERLSLGDALILAVTERLGLPVLSRDTYWALLAADGHTTAAVQTY